jgi:hypothetical protein
MNDLWRWRWFFRVLLDASHINRKGAFVTPLSLSAKASLVVGCNLLSLEKISLVSSVRLREERTGSWSSSCFVSSDTSTTSSRGSVYFECSLPVIVVRKVQSREHRGRPYIHVCQSNGEVRGNSTEPLSSLVSNAAIFPATVRWGRGPPH